jgi:hypothetical protein
LNGLNNCANNLTNTILPYKIKLKQSLEKAYEGTNLNFNLNDYYIQNKEYLDSLFKDCKCSDKENNFDHFLYHVNSSEDFWNILLITNEFNKLINSFNVELTLKNESNIKITSIEKLSNFGNNYNINLLPNLFDENNIFEDS